MNAQELTKHLLEWVTLEKQRNEATEPRLWREGVNDALSALTMHLQGLVDEERINASENDTMRVFRAKEEEVNRLEAYQTSVLDAVRDAITRLETRADVHRSQGLNLKGLDDTGAARLLTRAYAEQDTLMELRDVLRAQQNINP